MKKVLICDDAAFMRISLRRILEKGDFEIVGEASDGMEAARKYKVLSPDIVTMDITMPGVDGIEAINMIKVMDPKAKIIVISAVGQEAKIREAISLGVKGYLIKPFNDDLVLERMNKIK